MQERTLTSKNQITIEINDVVKMVNDKGRPILNHCTLHLEGPALVAIVGASGAGKSSLLYSMGGLDKPSQGSVVLNGINLYRLNNEKRAIFLRRNVGFIFQQYNLISYLSVRDNILLPHVFDGLQEDKSKLLSLLEQFSILNLEHEQAANLSGGEQQRVAICRSIYQNPSILFADEPTGALDSHNTKEVVSSLLDISQKGCLVVVVTHDPNVAEVADKIVFMNDGSIEDVSSSMSAEDIQRKVKELTYG